MYAYFDPQVTDKALFLAKQTLNLRQTMIISLVASDSMINIFNLYALYH